MPVRVMSLASSATIALALFWTPFADAQPRSLDISQYLHTSWTAQDGYFHGGVESVTQTADGYLWLTSTTGLLRFDGSRFVEWKPSGQDPLPGQPLRSLLGSKDGSLWIGGTGVAELTADGKFHRYHQLDGLRIEKLLEDGEGAVWAGGYPLPGKSPLCRLYRGSVECYGDTKFMGGYVGALYEDEQKRLWAGTSDGIWRVRPGAPQKISPSTGFVRALTTNTSGNLLFSNGPDSRVLSDSGKSIDYPVRIEGKPAEVYRFFKDREGGLWVTTRGQGLVHIHSGRTDRFTSLDGLSFDDTGEVFQDREGSIWVVTGNGLDRFSKPALPRITRKQGLSNDEVLAVLTDRNGATWITTSSGFDELMGDRLVNSKVKLPGKPLTLFQNSKGRVLVTTSAARGMAWLDGNNTDLLNVKSGENIFKIAEDNRGDLWIDSREQGLLHVRASGGLIEAFQWKDLGFKSYSVVFDATRQGIWLASAEGNLALFKDGQIVERYGPADGLGTGVLRDVQVEKNGDVLVSTRLGLARLRHGQIATLGSENGLPCDAVHWMMRDDDRNVWLYTECGLVSVSDTDFSAWIAQPSHKVTATNHLDNTEGVECIAYNGWYTPQAARTNDGRILFAMTSGLGVLDPRYLNRNMLRPPVHIEELFVDGREIKRSDPTSFPKRTRTVRLTFTALSLVAPRKVRFRYKLEGFDSNWSDPVSAREATYTNLPPGDYTFRVIASNNDGVWNETGAFLNFSVPPAFYQMVWFRTLCLAVFLLLLWAVYRIRVRRLQRQFAIVLDTRVNERSRIARELHDTLLQSFQGLILNFQRVRNLLPGRPDEAIASLDTALQRAESAIMEGRDAIHDIRASMPHDADLAEVVSALGEELAPEKGKSGVPAFRVVVEGVARAISPDASGEIYRITREALRNAYHHAHARNIEAEIRYEERLLRVRVRDDGIGIEEDHLGRSGRIGHYGLQGMRERAARMGAQFDIWSKEGAGAEIELRVPHTIAYSTVEPDNIVAALNPNAAHPNKF